MYRRELLNDWDKKIMEFLRFLTQRGNRATKKAVAQKLALTRPTLLKLVADIQAIFKDMEGFQLTASNYEYYLHIDLTQNLSFITKYLMQYSRKYKILKEIFFRENVNVNYFCDLNGLSMATYYAEVKELNQLLLEFDLVIKNNQIQGSELQIRHFFSSLFFHTLPVTKIEQLQEQLLPTAFISDLEQCLEIRVNHCFLHELTLYLWVVKIRSEQGKDQLATEADFVAEIRNLGNRESFISGVQEMSSFGILKNLCHKHLVYFPTQKNSEVSRLICFFMSHHFSSSDSLLFRELKDLGRRHNFVSFRFVQTFLFLSEATSTKNSYVVYNVIKSIWQNILLKGQIMMDQAIFFNRYLDELEAIDQKKHFDGIVLQLESYFPELFFHQKITDPLRGDLGRAFLYLQEEKEALYHVGIYYVGNQLLARQMTEYYLYELNKYPNLYATAWNSSSDFDIVLSNYEIGDLIQKEQLFYINVSHPELNIQEILKYVKTKQKRVG
ncbi:MULTISPECIES: helix-turn-helix domain-containing protein [unclassified Enterococcus]|uniref:helix-turn-helix domain-containing protein n=1 Tax=unclassified Enterococcus TaxID=2608891 RepID=UPI001E613955|nr:MULTISPECIES: helix-turn-helix domain-containing protein [unclassified Enterococcus]MCD1023886.1 helix-turn-helix domain-containing protein [Enterococcus sp. SMC-9]